MEYELPVYMGNQAYDEHEAWVIVNYIIDTLEPNPDWGDVLITSFSNPHKEQGIAYWLASLHICDLNDRLRRDDIDQLRHLIFDSLPKGKDRTFNETSLDY